MNESENLFCISNGYGDVVEVLNIGSEIFEENTDVTPKKVGDNDKYRGYVPWGSDNKLPMKIISMVRKDEVMSQNQLFNTLCCYSGGVKITQNGDTKLSGEVASFFKRNRAFRFFGEQVNDMKHFFFSVAVIILSVDGKKIVKVVHKDACYCRFETCDPDTGKIEHVYFANWDKAVDESNVEIIPLLDKNDPIGDLEVRMGISPNEKGEKQTAVKERKFAILNDFPCVGNKYYPFVPFWAIFESGWYDIKQMIPVGKKAKFKNSLAVRWIVEIHTDYKKKLIDSEGIKDPVKIEERWLKEKQNIKDYLMGIENEGKVWITGFYTNPKGEEVSYVKITRISKDKEGGDWIEDSEEASNMMCYAQGVHPSLIGATPGKTKGSFSGSDKRELFTMKQAMEIPFHDVLLEPYRIIQEYNAISNKEWETVEFDIPIVQLTTLDKGSDSQTTSTNKMKGGKDDSE